MALSISKDLDMRNVEFECTRPYSNSLTNASHSAGAVGSPAAPCRAVGSPNLFACHNEA